MNQNALPLFNLSKKYETPSPIMQTEQYLQDYNLSLKYLLFFQNKPNLPLYEFIDQVSNHFLDHIHDQSNDLLKLNFNLLYQIIEKGKNKSFLQIEYIDFLFNCLDKYGRLASALFQNIDFESLQMKYFQRLMINKILDFVSYLIILWKFPFSETIHNMNRNEIERRLKKIFAQKVAHLYITTMAVGGALTLFLTVAKCKMIYKRFYCSMNIVTFFAPDAFYTLKTKF